MSSKNTDRGERVPPVLLGPDSGRKIADHLEQEHVMTEEHNEYLNDLRDSGATNMFGATPYLEDEFGLDQKEARSILSEWMESFSNGGINDPAVKENA
jgi:uncharacterized protein YciI